MKYSLHNLIGKPVKIAHPIAAGVNPACASIYWHTAGKSAAHFANCATIESCWGRPGFDRGYKAAQGIPRAGHLVNTTRKYLTANDNSYALAA